LRRSTVLVYKGKKLFLLRKAIFKDLFDKHNRTSILSYDYKAAGIAKMTL